MPETMVIRSDGPNLAADLYLPARLDAPVPGLVTGSGFGGVKEMLLPHFASALARAGFATLAIDYAGFGASSGTPRQDLDPLAQIRDLRRGLDRLASDPRIDSQRLGVFGPSMCGAHTLVLAGTDSRVRAAVSLVPFVRAPRAPLNPRIAWALAGDVVRRALRLPSKLIASAGPPGSAAVMTNDGALAWLERMATDAPRFRNEITVRSLARLATYRPMRCLGPAGIVVPLRTILSVDDNITPAALARRELRGVEQDVQELPGTHFELFGEHLDHVTQLTIDWFAKHLSVARTWVEQPARVD